MAIVTIGVRPKNISWLEIALVFNHCITYFGIILIDIKQRLKSLKNIKLTNGSRHYYLLSLQIHLLLYHLSPHLFSTLLLYQDKSLLFLKDICNFSQNVSASHKNGFKVCFDGGEPQQQEWRRRSYCKPSGEVGRCLSGNKRILVLEMTLIIKVQNNMYLNIKFMFG